MIARFLTQYCELLEILQLIDSLGNCTSLDEDESNDHTKDIQKLNFLLKITGHSKRCLAKFCKVKYKIGYNMGHRHNSHIRAFSNVCLLFVISKSYSTSAQ